MNEEQKQLVKEYTATLASIKEHLYYFANNTANTEEEQELKEAVEAISNAIYSLMKGTWSARK